MNLTGNQNINLPNNGYDQISQEITISLWSFGDAEVLPTATSIFQGVDNQNRRQINVHLPWGNGTVFWDCGNNGML